MITKPLEKSYNLTLSSVEGEETLCSYASISDIKNKIIESPLPLEMITNNLGINLECIKMLSWKKYKNQLIEFSIHFNYEDDIKN